MSDKRSVGTALVEAALQKARGQGVTHSTSFLPRNTEIYSASTEGTVSSRIQMLAQKDEQEARESCTESACG